MSKLRRRKATVAATFLILATTAACGGGDAEGGDADSITVWTTDTLPDRVAKTESIIDRFTKETGIEVKLVGVAEDQFTQTLTSAAAAGDLPDVIGSLSLASVRTLAANELLDTDASSAVVESLGADTFSEEALALTRDGDTQLAVPSEIWSQLLIYRKDLFEEAGLQPPETYEEIVAAAAELDSSDVAGFVGPTAAGDSFTQQTFEHIALANGCELVDEAGEILLDSAECVGAFDFYGELVSDYSMPGAQDVDTVRAAYFSGKAAMIVWSTFILDEMAALRNDALPSCPECRKDPTFLAENSGFVTALQGPDGEEPAQFGEVVSWAIPTGSAADQAQQFVEYLLSDGYVDWLSIAPEGKFPARRGSAEKPEEYVETWASLPVGVDKKAPLADFYPPEVLEVLRTGPDAFDRWGIVQGQGDLVGSLMGELPVPKAVAALASGEVDAQGAAEAAAEDVRSIQGSQ
ncbi:MAG: extracellular solute-binding protein [Actinomycetota bacterium]|nr:extracellular solute-binding protein [Actinomycetota bacterium]